MVDSMPHRFHSQYWWVTPGIWKFQVQIEVYCCNHGGYATAKEDIEFFIFAFYSEPCSSSTQCREVLVAEAVKQLICGCLRTVIFWTVTFPKLFQQLCHLILWRFGRWIVWCVRIAASLQMFGFIAWALGTARTVEINQWFQSWILLVNWWVSMQSSLFILRLTYSRQALYQWWKQMIRWRIFWFCREECTDKLLFPFSC